MRLKGVEGPEEEIDDTKELRRRLCSPLVACGTRCSLPSATIHHLLEGPPNYFAAWSFCTATIFG